jgi:hypothetical protein
VVLWWIPGHTGLPSSEASTTAAMEATMHGNTTSDQALSCDLCASFLCGASLWQDEWTHAEDNKSQKMNHPCMCDSHPSAQLWESHNLMTLIVLNQQLSHVQVIVDRIWIGNWIYSSLTTCDCKYK